MLRTGPQGQLLGRATAARPAALPEPGADAGRELAALARGLRQELIGAGLDTVAVRTDVARLLYRQGGDDCPDGPIVPGNSQLIELIGVVDDAMAGPARELADRVEAIPGGRARLALAEVRNIPAQGRVQMHDSYVRTYSRRSASTSGVEWGRADEATKQRLVELCEKRVPKLLELAGWGWAELAVLAAEEGWYPGSELRKEEVGCVLHIVGRLPDSVGRKLRDLTDSVTHSLGLAMSLDVQLWKCPSRGKLATDDQTSPSQLDPAFCGLRQRRNQAGLTLECSQCGGPAEGRLGCLHCELDQPMCAGCATLAAHNPSHLAVWTGLAADPGLNLWWAFNCGSPIAKGPAAAGHFPMSQCGRCGCIDWEGVLWRDQRKVKSTVCQQCFEPSPDESWVRQSVHGGSEPLVWPVPACRWLCTRSDPRLLTSTHNYEILSQVPPDPSHS